MTTTRKDVLTRQLRALIAKDSTVLTVPVSGGEPRDVTGILSGLSVEELNTQQGKQRSARWKFYCIASDWPTPRPIDETLLTVKATAEPLRVFSWKLDAEQIGFTIVLGDKYQEAG